MIIETIQTTKAACPATPAMPPMLNNTKGGTPAAIQNAPRQSSVRCKLPDPVDVSFDIVFPFPVDGTLVGTTAVCRIDFFPRKLRGRVARSICRRSLDPQSKFLHFGKLYFTGWANYAKELPY
jgi:hypothetical protein